MTDAAADQRVLITAPAGRDAALLREALERAGIAALVCNGIPELIRETTAGLGTIVVTEEALAREGVVGLEGFVAAQPPWSDVPILILMRPRTPTEEWAALATAQSLGNVVMLNRPMSIVTFLSAVRAALRTRARQYEIRGHVLELDANSRAKDEFLAVLGHELRNPLAALKNGVLLLQSEKTSPAARAATLPILERQVAHMVRLVDDMLDLSRIMQGRIEISRQRVALQQELGNAIEMVRPLIDTRHHRLVVDMPPAAIWLDADPVRLTQIFENIITNAAKYSPDNSRIDVAVRRESDTAVVRVRDNGIGINPELMPHIFSQFVQLRRSSRRDGGLGLGLSVVHKLVEMHGGRVDAFSDGEGQGSEFVVRLPAAA